MLFGLRHIYWAAVLLLLPVSTSFAAQELTLALETPAPPNAQSKDPSADARAVETAPTPAASKPQSSQTTAVVGRVGVVQVATAYIYVRKSSRSSRYSTVRVETPLAIVREEGEWYGVLMTNRAIGWIPRKNVRLTDYNLVAEKPAARPESATSRGGTSVSRSLDFATTLIRKAMAYSGVRYVYGGSSPSRGMDCSAYVRSVFAHFGIGLPRTAREQALVGASVPFDRLQPGDRLYFACYSPSVDHCGIYAGNGYFIHCSKSRNGVGFDSLASDFFWRSLVTARRS